jgi:hypothetical protein
MLRAARFALLAAALLAAASCGGTPKTTVDLTFFTTITLTPARPVVGQNYAINFFVENTDEQHSQLNQVQWTVQRNGVVNAFSGSIPALISHQPVPIALLDNQPPGTYLYTITIDPNNLIPSINGTNKTASISVTVLPLTVM